MGRHEKAARLLEEERVTFRPEYSDDHDAMFEVDGDSDDYMVNIERKTGDARCTCPHPRLRKDNMDNLKPQPCSHQIAARVAYVTMKRSELEDNEHI